MSRGVKAEHSGAKNGGGHWGRRADAKRISKKSRRSSARKAIREHRSESYDEDLAKEMKDLKFAQQYLLSLIEDEDEPLSVEEALRIAIPRMGVAEFSRKIKKSKTDVDKFLRGERNLKPETLNEYLVPFRLRIKVTLEKVA